MKKSNMFGLFFLSSMMNMLFLIKTEMLGPLTAIAAWLITIVVVGGIDHHLDMQKPIHRSED